MLSYNRKYHYIGQLTIKKSQTLEHAVQPKDDPVNWLFLKVDDLQLSFVYLICHPVEAKYYVPFKIELAFTMVEKASETICLMDVYDVLRGEELVGTVKILKAL